MRDQHLAQIAAKLAGRLWYLSLGDSDTGGHTIRALGFCRVLQGFAGLCRVVQSYTGLLPVAGEQ